MEFRFRAGENLVSLNVSNNNFTGYLPDTKLFRQLSASDLAGNQGLCTHDGDVCFVRMDDNGQPVMTKEEESRRVHRLKVAIVLLITATVVMVAGGANDGEAIREEAPLLPLQAYPIGQAARAPADATVPDPSRCGR